MNDAPLDVLRVIMGKVADALVARVVRASVTGSPRFAAETGCVCRTLSALSGSCRDVRDALTLKDPWLGVLTAMADYGNARQDGARLALEAVREGRIDAARALRLVGMTGCQLCGAPRIRKVHWEFRVRCCQACLEENTVSDWRLREELGVVVSASLADAADAADAAGAAGAAGAAHSTVEMYGPRGAYTLKFYWRDDPALARACAASMRLGEREGPAWTLPDVCREAQRIRAESAAAAKLAVEQARASAALRWAALHDAVCACVRVEGGWRLAVLEQDAPTATSMHERSRAFSIACHRVTHHAKWAKERSALVMDEVLLRRSSLTASALVAANGPTYSPLASAACASVTAAIVEAAKRSEPHDAEVDRLMGAYRADLEALSRLQEATRGHQHRPATGHQQTTQQQHHKQRMFQDPQVLILADLHTMIPSLKLTDPNASFPRACPACPIIPMRQFSASGLRDHFRAKHMTPRCDGA
jgi:hypothetical protein